MPAGTFTDQIASDFMVFMKYYVTSFMMAQEIIAKDPGRGSGATLKRLGEGLQPMKPYLAPFKKHGGKGVTPDFIKQNASKMAKVSEAFYKFMVKEAKKAGVAVIKEVPKPNPSMSAEQIPLEQGFLNKTIEQKMNSTGAY